MIRLKYEVDMFDICDNCNWQNSGPRETENSPVGPKIKIDIYQLIFI